eukprot:SAG11_NODE_8936_length_961_cov_1.049884_1_plen_112_part_10
MRYHRRAPPTLTLACSRRLEANVAMGREAAHRSVLGSPRSPPPSVHAPPPSSAGAAHFSVMVGVQLLQSILTVALLHSRSNTPLPAACHPRPSHQTHPPPPARPRRRLQHRG